MTRSEYTANLQMTERTAMMAQVEKNRKVRAEVARIRMALAVERKPWYKRIFAW